MLEHQRHCYASASSKPRLEDIDVAPRSHSIYMPAFSECQASSRNDKKWRSYGMFRTAQAGQNTGDVSIASRERSILTFVFLFLQASQAFFVLLPLPRVFAGEVLERDEESKDDDKGCIACVGECSVSGCSLRD